jgi:GNAT superfamily N-acetyltransferase
MKLNANGLEVEVRAGTKEDVPLLLTFIRAMAEFEKLEVTATEKVLQESLFGERPVAEVVLAFVNGKPAAYAVYFFTFGTMTGKRGLWLDDIFVNPEFRRRGIAKALMAYLAEIAVKNECGRFEWMVLDWNKTAIALYQDMGATVLDEWRICRLENAALAEMANKADA